VSGKLIAQFATNLEALIASDNATAEEAATPESDGTAADSSGETVTAAAKPAPAPVMKQEESLNAFKFVVVPILKRVIPVAAVGAAVAVVIRKVTRRKS
jgi:anti-sigma factor RsiW